ncbi:MAG: PspA/IM30 family protein [Aggregatilineales bacterium]
MASLLDKINTLVNANLHSIIDRALESNSLKVMDEYIRQAEKNLDALEDSTATVGGTVKTLKRKYEEFAAAAEKLDRDIDTLIVKGKDDLASAAQAELNTKQQLSQDYYEQWQDQEGQYQVMLNMRLKLESRLTTIKQEREHLSDLLKLAEAKKVTTKTIKSLDDIAKVGDAEMTSISEQIRAKIDQEDARLEVATQNISDQIEDAVRGGEIDRQLEERRQRLLGKSGGDS